MADEPNPETESPVPPIPRDGETVAPGSGLPSNTAAGLAILFPLLGGLVFYYLDRKDPLVRYYALLSVALGFMLWLVKSMVGVGVAVFGSVWVIGGIFAWVLNALFTVYMLVWFTVWIITTIWAFRGKRLPIPYLTPVLNRLSLKLP